MEGILMGTIIQMFDEVEKRYVEKVIEIKDHLEMSDSDYKRIETALIKFADDLKMAN
jgi:hypothetical protein